MTDNYADLNFDSLEIIELPVRIKGQKYKLVEASGDVIVKYNNKATSSAIIADGKPIGMKGVADIEPLLVSGCLFYDDPTFGAMNGKNVPESVVRSWPGRIMNPLFKKAKEISEMDTPSTAEEIKNQIDKLQEQHTKMLEDKDSLGNDSDSMEDT